jgi:hypothetical protein
MGTGCKVLLILGIIFLVGALACCGCLGWLGYSVSKGVSDDPAVVRSVTDEMLGVEVLDGLDPALSMDVNIPVMGHMMTFVVWQDMASQSMLVLAQMGEMVVQGQSEEQMQQQLEDQLNQQGQGADFNVQAPDIRQQVIEVRGQPVTFTIATGEDDNTGASRIQVTGMIPGDDGPILLMFTGDADVYPEEDVVGMIESID